VNGLDDYRLWRDRLRPEDHVLLIGAGLIGVEFANDLALAGYPVTVVEPAPRPLGRLLPAALGTLLCEVLAQAGIEVICGQAVSALEPADERSLARLTDGQSIVFDKALSAIGLSANTTLAAESGLSVDQGIVVNAYLETSYTNIFALGDCAQTDAGMLPYVLPLMAEARALANSLVTLSSRSARISGRFERCTAPVCKSMAWVALVMTSVVNRCASRLAGDPFSDPGNDRFKSRRSGR
jgi:rubredoxin-NAD+ reductase